jgi:serine/threonine-protein kinase
MAPEQLAGDSVGPAADVWAAGVLLYTCVSGQRPFASADLPQLLGALHLSEPTPLATIAPDVPPQVAAIIAELLQKPPDARPRAHDVADRLRIVASRAPSATPPQTVVQSARSVSGAVGPAPSPLAQVAPSPAPGERTRAFQGTARVGRLAAALAGLGVLTTCAVGLALAALFVSWRESPTLASVGPTPGARSTASSARRLPTACRNIVSARVVSSGSERRRRSSCSCAAISGTSRGPSAAYASSAALRSELWSELRPTSSSASRDGCA